MSGTTEKKARPQPVRQGKDRGKGEGKGESRGKGRGKGKGKGKGKGNLTRGSISLNNVSNLKPMNHVSFKRRPKPVRRRTQNNVSTEDKIARHIAQRRANNNALEELKGMRVKNNRTRTFKQRKEMDQMKKGVSLNDSAQGISLNDSAQGISLNNTTHRHFIQSKKNVMLSEMEQRIPKGLSEAHRKIWTDAFKVFFEEQMDKHKPRYVNGNPPEYPNKERYKSDSPHYNIPNHLKDKSSDSPYRPTTPTSPNSSGSPIYDPDNPPLKL
jgi:hypothetical protein